MTTTTDKDDTTMEEITVADSYGRRTVFTGELLVDDTTDTDDARKPQWLEIDIWRSEGGSYIVRKAVRYRILHTRRACTRLDGYDVRPATDADTFPCPTCEGGTGAFGQEDRVTVDAYRTPEELIASLKVKGEYTRLSRTLLADLSELDDYIDAIWNTVVVD